MIFRTEIRNSIRIEQVINDEDLVNIVNEYLANNHYITDKEDEEAVPELELDFILLALNGKISGFKVYRKEKDTPIWTEDWIDDIIDECVTEYFSEIPAEIIELGDIVDVEYEREEY